MEAIKRTDAPNLTLQQLLDSGWVFLDIKYEYLIRGFLKMLRSELDRVYWNEHQKEMISPFDNTGSEDFVTDYLTVRSYNWSDDTLPNLDTDKLKIFWYKHSDRGVMAMVKNTNDIGNLLAEVLNNSIKSINT